MIRKGKNPRWFVIRITAYALAVTPVILAAVGTFIVRSGASPGVERNDPDFVALLMPILGGFGVLMAVASHPVRNAIARHLGKKHEGVFLQTTYQKAMMIGLNLAEFPAVCGLLLAILSRTLLVPAALWGISFIVLLTHLPPRNPPAEAGERDEAVNS